MYRKYRCCLNFCYSAYLAKPNDGLSFHLFPSDDEKRHKWNRNIAVFNEQDVSDALHTNKVVCSQHFEPECFETDGDRKHLLKNAVPTIFPKSDRANFGPCDDNDMLRKAVVRRTKCCIRDCSTMFQSEPVVSYHEFPADELQRSKWLKNIIVFNSQDMTEGLQHGKQLVCSKHFESECFKQTENGVVLLSETVPTIFPQSKLDRSMCANVEILDSEFDADFINNIIETSEEMPAKTAGNDDHIVTMSSQYPYTITDDSCDRDDLMSMSMLDPLPVLEESVPELTMESSVIADSMKLSLQPADELPATGCNSDLGDTKQAFTAVPAKRESDPLMLGDAPPVKYEPEQSCAAASPAKRSTRVEKQNIQQACTDEADTIDVQSSQSQISVGSPKATGDRKKSRTPRTELQLFMAKYRVQNRNYRKLIWKLRSRNKKHQSKIDQLHMHLSLKC